MIEQKNIRLLIRYLRIIFTYHECVNFLENLETKFVNIISMCFILYQIFEFLYKYKKNEIIL